MTFPKLAWCGLLVVALHNAEEAITIPTWLPPRLAQIEAQFGIRPLAAATGRLYAGLLMATLVPILCVAIASRSAPHSAGAYSILVLYGIFLANAFVPHLLGVVLLASYVPGAITAGLLVVPFAVWLGRRAIADGYASGRGLAAALLIAVAVYVPGLWALLGVAAPGGRIARGLLPLGSSAIITGMLTDCRQCHEPYLKDEARCPRCGVVNPDLVAGQDPKRRLVPAFVVCGAFGASSFVLLNRVEPSELGGWRRSALAAYLVVGYACVLGAMKFIGF